MSGKTPNVGDRVYWIEVPFTSRELSALAKGWELTGPGTKWAMLRRRLVLNDQPYGAGKLVMEGTIRPAIRQAEPP